MPSPLDGAIEQVQRDIALGRISAHNRDRLDELIAQRDLAFREETEVLAKAQAMLDAQLPQTVRICPTGEEGFRCRKCNRLIEPGARLRSLCRGCEVDEITEERDHR